MRNHRRICRISFVTTSSPHDAEMFQTQLQTFDERHLPTIDKQASSWSRVARKTIDCETLICSLKFKGPTQ